MLENYYKQDFKIFYEDPIIPVDTISVFIP